MTLLGPVMPGASDEDALKDLDLAIATKLESRRETNT